MKTAREWFEQQPEPMRTVLLNALERCPERGHLPYPNLRDAVIWAFDYHPTRDQFKFLIWGIRQAIDWGVDWVLSGTDSCLNSGAEIYQVSQQPRPKGAVLWYEMGKDGKPYWVWRLPKAKNALPIPDELPTQVAYISIDPAEYKRLKEENERLRDANEANRKMAFVLMDAGITTAEQLQQVISDAQSFNEIRNLFNSLDLSDEH